jgi:cytidyltransferase-like protein
MRGLTIITYGNFDLFHDGHRYLLETALKSCFEGRLFIFLASNDYVRETRGENRPKDVLTVRSGNIESYISEWCKKNGESPRVKIGLYNSEHNLIEQIVSNSPNMIVIGESKLTENKVDKFPILIVPLLKDRFGKIISTSQIIKDYR